MRKFSVALIGPDGAGKTTIANRLREDFPLPIKYLYMGVSVGSSNVALPTTRIAAYVKRALLKNKKRTKDEVIGSRHDPLDNPIRKNRSKNPIRAILRVINRSMEEWFRQILSWWHQMRGSVVLYDRHFLFDYEKGGKQYGREKAHWSDRMHRWLLHTFYPEPDLVLYLDASPEILFARKGEGTIEYLASRRMAFLAQGERMNNFVRIDAGQPLDSVMEEVKGHILHLAAKRGHKVAGRDLEVVH